MRGAARAVRDEQIRVVVGDGHSRPIEVISMEEWQRRLLRHALLTGMLFGFVMGLILCGLVAAGVGLLGR